MGIVALVNLCAGDGKLRSLLVSFIHSLYKTITISPMYSHILDTVSKVLIMSKHMLWKFG